MEDKVKKVGLMKDNVVRMCKELKAQSSILYLFSLQWKDLEDYLDNAKRVIEDRYEEVKLLEREVEERLKEVELKESEMSSVKRKKEEYQEQAIKMERKIGSLEKILEERSNGCEEKERQLVLAQNALEECNLKVVAKESELRDLMSSIKECSSFFSLREELELLNRRVNERGEELVLNEKKLALVKDLLQKTSGSVDLEMKKWQSVQDMLGECCGELESKREKLVSVEKALEESETSLMLKMQELDSLEKSKETSSGEFQRKEIESREEQLMRVQDKIKRCQEELQLKEQQSAAVQISIGQCSQQLDLKRKELAEIEVSMSKCSDVLESKQEELQLVEASTSKQFEELKMKENDIHSLEASVKEQSEVLERKQEQFEEKLKEFEVQKRWLVSLKESMENHERESGLKEENDTVVFEVKEEDTEDPLEAGSRKSFWFWSWEHLEKHDGVSTELLSTLKASSDPAQFALDALKMFSHMESRKKDERVDIHAIRKCLLLEHLMSIMPQVRPSVQKDAMTLAVKWKVKIEILLEHYSLMVLAFLQLVAAYGFSSTYDANELWDFLNWVSDYRKINQLRQALGLMKDSPGFCGTISPAAVPNQSTPVTSAQAISTIDRPNSSQSYSQSPQAGKRIKELAKKRKCDFHISSTVGGYTQ